MTTPGNNNISLASFDFAAVVFTPTSNNFAGSYGFDFINDGSVVATVTGSFGEPIPEPSTAVLAAIGLGLAVRRRR